MKFNNSIIISLIILLMGCSQKNTNSIIAVENQQLEIFDTDNILFLEDEYVPPNESLLGSPGMYKYVFKPKSKGKGIVELQYFRTWEKRIASLEQFIVTFEIK